METAIKTEVVICTCSQEHGISGQVCCLECNREILTRMELEQLKAKLESTMRELKTQAAHIDIELFMRKEHKPSRKVLYYEDFFKGVKKTPMEHRKWNSVDYKAEAKAMLASLD